MLANGVRYSYKAEHPPGKAAPRLLRGRVGGREVVMKVGDGEHLYVPVDGPVGKVMAPTVLCAEDMLLIILLRRVVLH